MKTTITTAQLEVLNAAGRNEVSKPAPGWAYDTGTWRIGKGRSVTTTVEALIRRGLARESTELVDDRRPLVVTADGYKLLSAVSHHG